MTKSSAAFALTVLLLPATALAQPVPVAFQARVTSAQGADAGVFSAGDSLTISYTVETSAADLDGDPQAGVFPGATNHLTVSFPTRGVFAQGTSGSAQTFDNFDSGGTTSDQIFLFSGPLASSTNLGGNPIQDAEVDFLSDFIPPPGEPLMISSDALPAFVPPFDRGFVILRTSNGTTFIDFELGGPLAQISANGSDAPVAIQAGDALTVEMRFDAPGAGLASATLAIAVVTPSGVAWLGPTGFTTTPTAAYSGPLNDFGPTPLFDFPSTAAFAPGSYTFVVLVWDNDTGDLTADLVQVTIL
jgi:hypothetical protein